MLYKKNNNLIIMCNCGCDSGLSFKILQNQIFISSIQSNFYSKQKSHTEKVKHILKRFFHKKIYLVDIILDKNEKKELIKNLYELYDSIIDSDEVEENYSLLKAYKIKNETDYDNFGLYIQSKQNILDILRNKEYRAYDIVYNKKEFFIFIKTLENFL